MYLLFALLPPSRDPHRSLPDSQSSYCEILECVDNFLKFRLQALSSPTNLPLQTWTLLKHRRYSLSFEYILQCLLKWLVLGTGFPFSAPPLPCHLATVELRQNIWALGRKRTTSRFQRSLPNYSDSLPNTLFPWRFKSDLWWQLPRINQCTYFGAMGWQCPASGAKHSELKKVSQIPCSTTCCEYVTTHLTSQGCPFLAISTEAQKAEY